MMSLSFRLSALRSAGGQMRPRRGSVRAQPTERPGRPINGHIHPPIHVCLASMAKGKNHSKALPYHP